MKKNRFKRRTYRPHLESLEPRLMLASVQLLNYPSGFASGNAEIDIVTDTEWVDGNKWIGWHAYGKASPQYRSSSSLTGVFDWSGDLTFRVTADFPEEEGELKELNIRSDHWFAWDLDPNGENLLYGSVAFDPIGRFFEFERGATKRGIWSTADSFGGPSEQQFFRTLVEVGETYTFEVGGGGHSTGLWIGATDLHGEALMGMDIEFAVRDPRTDVAVNNIQVLDNGDISIEHHAERLEVESSVNLYWGAESSVDGKVYAMGRSIYSIPRYPFQSANQTTVVSYNDLRTKPPKYATHLLAIADPANSIKEHDEENNRNDIDISADFELTLRVDGARPATASSLCFSCAPDTVIKRRPYTLVASVTNNSPLPHTFSFDVEETLLTPGVNNLVPAPLSGADRLVDFKPIYVAPGQTEEVDLKLFAKSWDWIPRQSPFSGGGSKISDALSRIETLNDFREKYLNKKPTLGSTSVKIFNGFTSVLGGLDFLDYLAQVNQTVDLQYDVQLHQPNILTRRVEDTKRVSVRTPNKFVAKWIQSLTLNVIANAAQGQATKGYLAAAVTGGATLAPALLFSAAAKFAGAAADVAYLQAVDPPDANYDELVEAAFAEIEPDLQGKGFLSALAQWQADRIALQDAEASSRDKGLGAQDAGDTSWYITQLDSSSGFAAAGLSLDARLAVLEHLSAPATDAVVNNPAAVAAAITPSFPTEFHNLLRDEFGMTDSQIEAQRQEILTEGADQLFAEETAGKMPLLSATNSGLASVEELVKSVNLREEHFGGERKPLDSASRLRLDSHRSDVLGQIDGPPSLELLNKVEQYLQDARQTLVKVGDVREEGDLIEHLNEAHTQMLAFIGKDFSPSAFGRMVEGFGNLVRDPFKTQLTADLAQFQSDLAAGRHLDAAQVLEDMIDDTRNAPDSELLGQTRTSILGFLELWEHVATGGNAGPKVVRTTPMVETHSDPGASTVDLNLKSVFSDLDDGGELTYALVNNSDSNIATFSVLNNVLTVTPVAESNGVTQVTIAALDSEGHEIETVIGVETHGASPETQFAPIESQSLDEEGFLRLHAEAAVKDASGNWSWSDSNFEFDVAGLPNASIDTNGNLTWFASESQGGQSFDAVITATYVNTDLPTSMTIPFQVQVRDTLSPPVVSPLNGGMRPLGEEWIFQATAIDYDIPVETITYSLTDAPVGASITPAGEFRWTPSSTGEFSFSIVATDSSQQTHQEEVVVEVYEGELQLDVNLTGIQLLNESYETSWGSTVDVTSLTANLGSDPSPQSEIAYYLSDSPGGGAADVMLALAGGGNYLAHEMLPAGGTGPAQTAQLMLPAQRPSEWTGNDFWILTRLDPRDQISESSESDNFGAAGDSFDAAPVRIVSTSPDLTVESVLIPNGLAEWGNEVTLETRVVNRSASDAGPSAISYYLSRSPVGEPDDIMLAAAGSGATKVAVSEIRAGETVTSPTILAFPDNKPSGWSEAEYFIIPKVDVDGDVQESDENNNFGDPVGVRSARLGFAEADLFATNYAVPNAMDWGESFLVRTTIQNVGDADADEFKVRWLLSPNQNGANGIVLPLLDQSNHTRVLGVESGEFVDLANDLQLPAEPPEWFDGQSLWLFADVDFENEVPEKLEANNVGVVDYADEIFVADPSMQRPNLSSGISHNAPSWGQVLPVSIDLYNHGALASDDFKVQWFLSKDDQFDVSDQPLRLANGDEFLLHAGLSSGQQVFNLSIGLQFPEVEPEFFDDNDGYLLQVVDPADEIEESREWDNVHPRSISVLDPYPDLIMRTPSIEENYQTYRRESLPTAIWGNLLTIENRIENGNGTDAGPFETRWFLSRDDQWDVNDSHLKLADGSDGYELPSLDIRHDYNVQLQLPNTAPDGDASDANFFLIAVGDYGDAVAEVRDWNNIASTRFFIANTPEPNLRPIWFDVNGEEFDWGESFALNGSVTNFGNVNVTNDFEIRWFLSQDAAYSGDDIPLKTAAGQDGVEITEDVPAKPIFGQYPNLDFFTEQFAATLQLPDEPADWDETSTWLLMVTDFHNTVAESNEDDNASSVGVGFDILPLNIVSQTAHNSDNPFDVDDDGFFRINDAFIVVDAIRQGPLNSQPPAGPPYVDVNDDELLGLLDGFLIVDALRQQFSSEGEGEFDGAAALSLRPQAADSVFQRLEATVVAQSPIPLDDLRVELSDEDEIEKRYALAEAGNEFTELIELLALDRGNVKESAD